MVTKIITAVIVKLSNFFIYIRQILFIYLLRFPCLFRGIRIVFYEILQRIRPISTIVPATAKFLGINLVIRGRRDALAAGGNEFWVLLTALGAQLGVSGSEFNASIGKHVIHQVVAALLQAHLHRGFSLVKYFKLPGPLRIQFGILTILDLFPEIIFDVSASFGARIYRHFEESGGGLGLNSLQQLKHRRTRHFAHSLLILLLLQNYIYSLFLFLLPPEALLFLYRDINANL